MPKAVVQERYERLIGLQERISLEENTALIGRSVELLVAAGEGRKDTRTARMSGRARDGRLVHFTPLGADIRPGDIVTTTVTDAAPHHLIADGTVLHHRRTRAGDVHAAGSRGLPEPLGRRHQAALWASACPASDCLRVSRPHPDVPGEHGRPAKRRLRRVQGRHRGCRTSRCTGNRPRCTGVGHRHSRVRVAADVRAAAHRRRQGLGCAGGQRRRDRRRDFVAVAGVHLAGSGVQRGLLDAGPADQALGDGVDRAGRIDGGVVPGAACGLVAADRPRTAPRTRHRADPRLDHGDRADVQLGPGGVGAHRAATRGRGGAPPGRRQATEQGTAGEPRRGARLRSRWAGEDLS